MHERMDNNCDKASIPVERIFTCDNMAVRRDGHWWLLGVHLPHSVHSQIGYTAVCCLTAHQRYLGHWCQEQLWQCERKVTSSDKAV